MIKKEEGINMDMTTYISPELMVLVPVIYLIGMALKRSTVRDNLIPALLGLAGVFLAGLWIFATTPIADGQSAANALFGALLWRGLQCMATRL